MEQPQTDPPPSPRSGIGDRCRYVMTYGIDDPEFEQWLLEWALEWPETDDAQSVSVSRGTTIDGKDKNEDEVEDDRSPQQYCVAIAVRECGRDCTPTDEQRELFNRIESRVQDLQIHCVPDRSVPFAVDTAPAPATEVTS